MIILPDFNLSFAMFEAKLNVRKLNKLILNCKTPKRELPHSFATAQIDKVGDPCLRVLRRPALPQLAHIAT